MKPHRSVNKKLGMTLLALALSACGGSGESADPQGIYDGTLGASGNSGLTLTILDNLQFWGVYGTQTDGRLTPAGFFHGHGQVIGNIYTSQDGTSYEPGVSTSVALSTTVAGDSLTGIVATATTNTPLTTRTSTTVDYDSPAKLSDVAGTWSLAYAGGQAAATTIGADGTITGGAAGSCTFTGTLTPGSKNVFNLAFTYGPAPCAYPGKSLSGIAVTSVVNTAGQRQLIMAGVDVDQTSNVLLVGTLDPR
jgi:hypothetical protein